MNIISKKFESEKNKKALLYTLLVCGAILLLFFLISWKIQPVAEPVVQDLIEINLGNDEEGFGDMQPLIKGERSPAEEHYVADQAASAAAQYNADQQLASPDPNAEADAAPITKTEKADPKSKPVTSTSTTKNNSNNTQPVSKPAPKPAKPKLVYDGPGSGKGNNDTEDNGYKGQGNKTGDGDAGSPTGDKDSYGTTPGGRTGGPKVIRGKVVNYYSFKGELPKATIYAEIKVSPAGKGSLLRLVRPSTSFENGYSTAIRQYLTRMQFDKAASESIVTVQFNFTVQ